MLIQWALKLTQLQKLAHVVRIAQDHIRRQQTIPSTNVGRSNTGTPKAEGAWTIQYGPQHWVNQK